jgi:site-specific DNA-methyltransferase (adenine-specific)
MRIVGNCEYAVLLFRDKLPKFNNHGNMVFNCLDWPRDFGAKKIHPTQKPLGIIERLIELFTDEDEVVIDPVAGSGITLLAARNLNRRAYGFEIKKDFIKDAQELIKGESQSNLFCSYKRKNTQQYRQAALEAEPERP